MTRTPVGRSVIGMLCVLATLAIVSGARAENLVPDPSFETGAPAWLSPEGKRGCFVAKEKVSGAADGSHVLAIEGWADAGTRIASKPVSIRGRTLSATMRVRSFGDPAGTLELSLYDLSGKKKLASFGVAAMDGKRAWSAMRAVGVRLGSDTTRAKLVVTVRGASRGRRVEIDAVGLFLGVRLHPVVDTAVLDWFEAEGMATKGPAWQSKGHFVGWYRGFPSGDAMLSGSGRATQSDDAVATKVLAVRRAGEFTLWTRFLRVNAPHGARFTVSLRQRGKTVASLDVQDSDPKYGEAPLSWVFAPLAARLQAGAVEVVLSRPAEGASWIARKVDLLVLTNLADYRPRVVDFRTRGYVRFTNLGETAFCWRVTIRRHAGPDWVTARTLTRAGLGVPSSCPEETRLAPAEPSSWVELTEYLSPAHGHNNVSFVATVGAAGLVSGRIRGRFEFAVGTEHRIVEAVDVDQTSPRVLMTLGTKLAPATVRTAWDYVRKERSVIAGIASASRPRARYLDLSTTLGGIDAERDPGDLVEQEVANVRALGFNATYTPLVAPGDLKPFHAQHALGHVGIIGPRPRFVAGGTVDRAALAESWGKIARDHGPILDRIERAKIFDEPRAISYERLLASPDTDERFASWLRSQALAPADLGVQSWKEVVPVGPERRLERPQAFYWTAMYRLGVLADVAKAVVAAKKAAHVPDGVKTYTNYSPTWGNQSFTRRGTDPFLMQRDGGFEMGWTEDWLGHGASVQQVSDHVAVIRAAGAPTHQALGMYVVGVDGPAELQRARLYEALAAGVRHICSYSYGPYYAGIDSWGARYEVYPYIADALHEFATIDEALHGTVRRKSDVAILYNRAAAIWAGENTATEQDGRYLFWALAHAGYQPDFIAEEDVERSGLGSYRVLYVTGFQLRRRAAEAIRQWVSGGGAVFATAGAGTRDEYERPMDVLDDVFGARSHGLSLVANPGRPKYELRKLRPLGVVETFASAGVPEAKLNRLCVEETLEPEADAKVIARSESGAPAGVIHRFGKGMAMRLAALPGIAYLHDAVTAEGYDPRSYRPTAYRTELRDLIGWLPELAHAERVRTNAPTVEVVRYDASDRTVLIVVNHGAPMPGLELELSSSNAIAGRSATGTPVRVTPSAAGESRVAFRLDVADAIVLQHRAKVSEVVRAAPGGAGTARCGCRVGAKSERDSRWGLACGLALAVAGLRRASRLSAG